MLNLKTARVFKPLLYPKRYKGAKGGRGSGKSHFFAEMIVEAMMLNPNLRVVCIREIQKSLEHSSKSVIEVKINSLGVGRYFEVLKTVIRSRVGVGLIIFQGMQDHTADSIKSLEGFDIAWVEEAQNLSQRSLELLRPTIRKSGSELWFSWNPENSTDPVDEFFRELERLGSSDYTLVHANFYDNPFLPDELLKEQLRDKISKPATYDHIWLGDYRKIHDALVFKGIFELGTFYPTTTPYYGLDFGFSRDPLAFVKVYFENNIIYIEKEIYKIGVRLDDTARLIKAKIPEADGFTIRADSSEPKTLDYLSRHGLSRIKGAKKPAGSVESGIRFMQNTRIIIHPDCDNTAFEFRNYSYKVDKRSGDILPILNDKFNHSIDAIRYALEPIILNSTLKKTTRRILI